MTEEGKKKKELSTPEISFVVTWHWWTGVTKSKYPIFQGFIGFSHVGRRRGSRDLLTAQ